MPPSQILTRTQQRVRKRQAWVLLLLVLGVALGSFALGFLVGRSSQTVAQDRRSERARQPVTLPVPPPPEERVSVATSVAPPSGERPAGGERPLLGNGINLPSVSSPALAANKTSPAQHAVAAPVTEPTSAAVAAKNKKEPDPNRQPLSTNSYQILTASFPTLKDAEDFARRLQRKGYQTAIAASEVKGKSWYRVTAGPYADFESATAAAERLRSEDRVSPIVRKRRP